MTFNRNGKYSVSATFRVEILNQENCYSKAVTRVGVLADFNNNVFDSIVFRHTEQDELGNDIVIDEDSIEFDVAEKYHYHIYVENTDVVIERTDYKAFTSSAKPALTTFMSFASSLNNRGYSVIGKYEGGEVQFPVSAQGSGTAFYNGLIFISSVNIASMTSCMLTIRTS